MSGFGIRRYAMVILATGLLAAHAFADLAITGAHIWTGNPDAPWALRNVQAAYP